jgi:prepilin-type N-terminal cleavage/methylation domain-containing protein
MQFLYLLNKKNSKGFTLVELLIVIAIIGLLASIVIPNLMKAKEKARLSNGISFSSAISKVLAFQNYKNSLVYLNTSNAQGVNGVSANSYQDPTSQNRVYYNQGATDTLVWSNDTPNNQGSSLKSNSSSIHFYNPNNSAIFSMPEPTNQLSFEFWLKRETAIADFELWTPLSITNDWISIKYLSAGGIEYTYAQNNIPFPSVVIPNTSTLNRWQHHVISIKNGQVVYYLDGQKKYDLSSSAIIVPQINNLYIQMRTPTVTFIPNSNIFYFHDFRVWGNFFDPANP